METYIYIKCVNNRPSICGLQLCFLIGLIYFICWLMFAQELKNMKLEILNVYLLFDGLLNVVYSNTKKNQRLTSQPITIDNRELQEINWKLRVKNIRYDEPQECLICYESNIIFSEFTNCTHTICYICLLKIQKNECPFCRELIYR